MAETWKLTLRRGPKVDVSRFATLDEALAALERALDGAGDVRRDATRALVREIEPSAQVPVRAQVSGPQRVLAKVHAGVDLRGDGSAIAWTGRVTKRIVDREAGEGPVEALRRALG